MLQSSFVQEDLNLAVAALFRYCMRLHGAMGISQKNCSIYDYGEELGEIAGQEYAENYRCIAKIYQKAVYSASEVTREEWEQMMSYKESLMHLLKNTFSLPKRASLKWVKGLY